MWVLITQHGHIVTNQEEEPGEHTLTYWKEECPNASWQEYAPVKRRGRKQKRSELPKEVWTIALHGVTPVGSFSSVTSGEKFFATAEEAQEEIDGWKPWIGMGDRKRYRPHRLVDGTKTEVAG